MLKQVVTVGALGVLMSGCSMFNKSTDSIDTAQTITPFAVKKAYEHKAKVVEEQVEKLQDKVVEALDENEKTGQELPENIQNDQN